MTGTIEEEFNEKEKNRAWPRFLQEINMAALATARKDGFTVHDSKKNVRLNRYGDVQPYDHSRIKLLRKNFDYINANIVKCERANRKYILCQGPLPGTVNHFWLMVWEQNSKAILMLNKLVEERHIKCHLYWPDKMGEANKLEMPDVGLTVEYVKCENYANFCKRTFKLTDTESTKSREVIQFHYTKWPDFGIPDTPIAFLRFLQSVRVSGVMEENVGPAIVHCSAGIGRSGTFCLVDCCLIIIDKYGESSVYVKEILLELRKYRMGLIQTADQLYFSYRAILEGMKYLKDNTFESLEDEPIITNDDCTLPHSDCDEPPPLPPLRSHSLHLQQQNATDIMNSVNAISDSSKLNNNETSQQPMENHLANRPLPPLPKQLIDIPASSDSDSSGEEEIVRSINTSEEDDYEKDASDLDVEDIELQEDNPTSNNAMEMNGNGDDGATSPTSEIRRRKRVERQHNMEDKIREIKRKQKEIEDNAITAKKRRENIRAK